MGAVCLLAFGVVTWVGREGGGAGGTLPPYFYNAIVVLSKMSYSPTGL